MPRVVIACPPLRDFYVTPHRLAALGMEALCRCLSQRGHDVIGINFPYSEDRTHRKIAAQTIPLPPELRHLKPYLLENETGPVSFFTAWKHWGPDFESCARRILDERPDVVCLSCFAYAYAEEAVLLSRALKVIQPGVPILAGGAGPTVRPEYYLTDSGIDAVVSGEGEEALPRLVEAIASGKKNELDTIPGVWLRVGGDIRHTDALLSRPADVACLIAGGRMAGEKRCYSVSYARGCPRHCAFCSNHLVHGRRFRAASSETIENALVQLHQALAAENTPPAIAVHFNFEDDNLLIDYPLFRDALELCRRYFPGASFSAENGLDYTLLYAGMVDELISAGFTQFNLSLVTIDPVTSRRLDRPQALDHFQKIVVQAAAKKIPVIAYFIAGLPGDTPKRLVETLGYLAALPVRIGFSPFYAVPGTVGFEDPNLFADRPPRLSLGSALYPWTGSLITGTLVTAFRLSRFINLIKSDSARGETEIIELFNRKKSLFTFIRSKEGRKIIEVPDYDSKLVAAFFEHPGFRRLTK